MDLKALLIDAYHHGRLVAVRAARVSGARLCQPHESTADRAFCVPRAACGGALSRVPASEPLVAPVPYALARVLARARIDCANLSLRRVLSLVTLLGELARRNVLHAGKPRRAPRRLCSLS